MDASPGLQKKMQNSPFLQNVKPISSIKKAKRQPVKIYIAIEWDCFVV